MDIRKIEMLFAKAKANKNNSAKFLQYCREMKEEIYREENKNGK